MKLFNRSPSFAPLQANGEKRLRAFISVDDEVPLNGETTSLRVSSLALVSPPLPQQDERFQSLSGLGAKIFQADGKVSTRECYQINLYGDEGFRLRCSNLQYLNYAVAPSGKIEYLQHLLAVDDTEVNSLNRGIKEDLTTIVSDALIQAIDKSQIAERLIGLGVLKDVAEKNGKKLSAETQKLSGLMASFFCGSADPIEDLASILRRIRLIQKSFGTNGFVIFWKELLDATAFYAVDSSGLWLVQGPQALTILSALGYNYPLRDAEGVVLYGEKLRQLKQAAGENLSYMLTSEKLEELKELLAEVEAEGWDNTKAGIALLNAAPIKPMPPIKLYVEQEWVQTSDFRGQLDRNAEAFERHGWHERAERAWGEDPMERYEVRERREYRYDFSDPIYIARNQLFNQKMGDWQVYKDNYTVDVKNSLTANYSTLITNLEVFVTNFEVESGKEAEIGDTVYFMPSIGIWGP